MKLESAVFRSLASAALVAIFMAGLAAFLSVTSTRDAAAGAAELNAKARGALERLYAAETTAKEVGSQAVAVLVFPKITKAGMIVGGQYGEGALLSGDKTMGYYITTAASFGLQIGGQTFGYAMFFMNEAAMKHLDDNDGWDVGTSPTLVYGDEGWSAGMNVSDLTEEILIFFFGQQGLMAGGGIQGTKITRFNPD
jgi:lipid-binding SYLF domain-containing protein